MKLQFGCGRKPIPGFVNVDNRALPGVDVVMDVEKDDWPWEESSVDFLVCHHLLEHLHDLIGFMDKAHRILKPGGQLHVRVPHHRHRNADTDPTHVRRFTENSFDYWYPGTSFEGFSDLHWLPLYFKVHGGKKIPILWRLHPSLKHHYLLPPHELEWILVPVKE